MTITLLLCLAGERAQHIDRSASELFGHGWYVVPSSRDHVTYT